MLIPQFPGIIGVLKFPFVVVGTLSELLLGLLIFEFDSLVGSGTLLLEGPGDII